MCRYAEQTKEISELPSKSSFVSQSEFTVITDNLLFKAFECEMRIEKNVQRVPIHYQVAYWVE